MLTEEHSEREKLRNKDWYANNQSNLLGDFVSYFNQIKDKPIKDLHRPNNPEIILTDISDFEVMNLCKKSD